MKRYFEYKDATSSKFWEIQLKGKNISTRYGKIGTDGQTSKKLFTTIDLAKKECEKLVKEKTKKGYKEKRSAINPQKSLKEKKSTKPMSNLELMKYWGSFDYEVDKERVKNALKDNAKRYKTLPNFPFARIPVQWETNRYDEFNDKTTAHEYLKKYTDDVDSAFILLLTLRYALTTKPTVTKIKGDVIINRWITDKDGVVIGETNQIPENGYYFFHGDLHIDGNFNFGMNIYITGNLIVKGVITDIEEWSQLLVEGNIKAGGIQMGSHLFCAGEISAPIVGIYNKGQILVGNKLTGKILIEDNDYLYIQGNLNVKHHIKFNEEPEDYMGNLNAQQMMETNWKEREKKEKERIDNGLKRLEKLIQPEIVKK